MAKSHTCTRSLAVLREHLVLALLTGDHCPQLQKPASNALTMDKVLDDLNVKVQE